MQKIKGRNIPCVYLLKSFSSPIPSLLMGPVILCVHLFKPFSSPIPSRSTGSVIFHTHLLGLVETRKKVATNQYAEEMRWVLGYNLKEDTTEDKSSK